MSLKFGTDGIRGIANTELTPELSLALGRAAALVLGSAAKVSANSELHAGNAKDLDRPRFVIGRDTRLSGEMIQAALSAGLASGGADVVDAGVLPTPAVAHLSVAHGIPGAVISASHNPYADNGIKFFERGGKKLSDEIEEQLEAELAKQLSASHQLVSGADVGALHSLDNAHDSYVNHLIESMKGGSIDGLKVVLDCANGAASRYAAEVLSKLGARVDVIANDPNGMNINDACGSTHPEMLQHKVVELGAQVGLAFDGDADRVLAVDERGQLVDGDEIMAMLAIDAKATSNLRDNTLVVTVMSNLGLRLAMKRHGINVHETKVGDRYVLEALGLNNWSLGGEQSGHVIFSDLATTGDGLLTGLKLLAYMNRKAASLSELAQDAMTKLPQILRNVRVSDREAINSCEALWNEVRKVEAQLGETGRVLLRSSGTEPLVRVMIEAPTMQDATQACDHLCAVVEREIGAHNS